MATKYEFNPSIHAASIVTEQRHVNERIKKWLIGHGVDIDALGSGKGPSNADYLMATATYLGVLPSAKQLTATTPLSFNSGTGELSLGTVPITLGGTGQITAPLGFKALAPVAASAGQMLAYNTTTGAWEATTSPSLNRITDYGIIMGAVTPTIGVAYREMDSTHFLVNTSLSTLSLAPDGVSNDILADMAEATIKGRAAASGTGDPIDLTGAQAATIIGSIQSLGGIAGSSQPIQLFATGTSGTDFNVASATATHTFNLPTASATVRGALSSADWTTFNSKQAGDATLTSLAAISGVQGDIIYADGTDSWTRLAKSALSTRYLSNTGGGVNNPAWAQVSLSTGVTGSLPINSLVKGGAAGDMMAIQDNGIQSWVLLTGGAEDNILVFSTATSSTQPSVWRPVSGDLTNNAGAFTISSGAVTFAKFQNINTDRLLGRDTALAGPVEEIALNATLEFTGASNLQRAALTGDVTAAAGSNTTVIANDAVTFPKMRNAGANSVLVGAGSAGVGIDYAEISLDSSLTMTGTVLSVTTGVWQPLDATLTALAGLDATTGILVQTGADTFVRRTLSGTTNRITVGDIVAANSTVDISSSYVGQASITTLGTITTGTWTGTTIAIARGGTGQTTAPTAFYALAPSALDAADTGALIKFNGGTNVWDKMVRGSNGQFLKSGASDVSWATLADTDIPDHNLLGNQHGDTSPAAAVLGSMIYGDATPLWVRLDGNITTTRKFLRQVGNGAISAVPAWDTLVSGDLPSHTHAFSDITGTVPINQGGTGQTAKDEAFDALSPTTTQGDMIYHGATDNIRLAIGAEPQYLKVIGTTPTWVDLDAGDVTVGTLAVARGGTGQTSVSTAFAALAAQNISFAGNITPAQITANQNDYNPTGLASASTLRLDSDASRDITGLAGGANGRVLFIHNIGSNNIVLKDSSGSSSAANQFDISADITLAGDQGIIIQYDSTSSRWRSLGGVGGGGTPHDLLDGTIHVDTRVNTASLNSLIVGDGVALWDMIPGPTGGWGFLSGDNTTAALVAFSPTVPDDKSILFGSNGNTGISGDASGNLFINIPSTTEFMRFQIGAVNMVSFGMDTATGTKESIILHNASGTEYASIQRSGTADLLFNVGSTYTHIWKIAGGTEMTLGANLLTFEAGATDVAIDFSGAGVFGINIGATRFASFQSSKTLQFDNATVAICGWDWSGSVVTALDFYYNTGFLDVVTCGFANGPQFWMFGGGSNDPNLSWATNDQLDIRLGTTTAALFKTTGLDVYASNALEMAVAADKITFQNSATVAEKYTIGWGSTSELKLFLGDPTTATNETLRFQDKVIRFNNTTTPTFIRFNTASVISLWNSDSTTAANEAFSFDCANKRIAFEPANTNELIIDGGTDDQCRIWLGLTSTPDNEAVRFGRGTMTLRPSVTNPFIIDASVTGGARMYAGATEIMQVFNSSVNVFLPLELSAEARFAPIAAPGGITGGELWYDSTKITFGKYLSTNPYYDVNCKLTNTASTVITSVSGSTTDGSLVTTTQFLASTRAIGKTMKVTAWGTYNIPASGPTALTVYVRFQKSGPTNVTVLTTGSLTVSNTSGDRLWRLEGTITVRTTGASGTAFSQGMFTFWTTSDIVSVSAAMKNTATATIDWNSNQDIDVRATIGAHTVNAGTITLTNYEVVEMF